MNSKHLIALLSLVLLLGVGCVPPSDGASMEYTPMSEQEIRNRNDKCDQYLSFATTNYQNQDFESAIKNYNNVIDLGCGEKNAKNLFIWMGRAYFELGKLDSASYVFKQGLKYLPENTALLENAAWSEGKQNNVDNQIYYLDKILSLDESNFEILEELSDIYRDNARYNEQLNVLSIWLSYDQGNKKAIGEKKQAFIALGKDEFEVDRDRWQQEPTNIQYGLDYADGLIDVGRLEDAIEVLDELQTYEKYNEGILIRMGKTFLDLGNDDLAQLAYEDLFKVNNTDYLIPLELSKILIDKEEYRVALEWAEKAVQISGGKGVTYFQRGEVYFSTAEACSEETIKFTDKIVYEIAYNDYKEAVNRNYHKAKTRRDFLKENFITTKGDWFMLPDNEMEAKPTGECYNWITKTIKRKQ